MAKKTGVQGGPVRPPARPWSAEEMAAAAPLPIPAPPSDHGMPENGAPDLQAPDPEPPAATRHVAAGSGGQASGGGRPEEA